MTQPSMYARPRSFPAPGFDPKPRLAHLAERLSRTMGVARALAQGGRQLDLTGIDDGVGVLCAKILDLPDEDARTMLPALREMLGQVDALQAVLQSAVDRPDTAC